MQAQQDAMGRHLETLHRPVRFGLMDGDPLGRYFEEALLVTLAETLDASQDSLTDSLFGDLRPKFPNCLHDALGDVVVELEGDAFEGDIELSFDSGLKLFLHDDLQGELYWSLEVNLVSSLAHSLGDSLMDAFGRGEEKKT